MEEHQVLSAGGVTPAEDARRPFPAIQCGVLLAGVCAALFVRWGFTADAIFRALSLAVLLMAATADLRDRKVSNSTLVAFLICGFLGVASPADLIPRLASGLLFFIPPALVYYLRPSVSPGGADVKFTGALGFVLGPRGGLLCLAFSSILLAIFFTGAAICHSRKNDGVRARNIRVPVLPFLFAGAVMSRMII